MPAKDRNKGLKKHQDDFRRHWNQAFSNLAKLSADISPGELRVALRVLHICLLKGRLAVRLTDEYLAKLTDIGRSSLFAARASLAEQGIIGHSETKDDEGRWTYELLNPVTGKPFPSPLSSTGPVTVTESWGNLILRGD